MSRYQEHLDVVEEMWGTGRDAVNDTDVAKVAVIKESLESELETLGIVKKLKELKDLIVDHKGCTKCAKKNQRFQDLMGRIDDLIGTGSARAKLTEGALDAADEIDDIYGADSEVDD